MPGSLGSLPTALANQNRVSNRTLTRRITRLVREHPIDHECRGAATVEVHPLVHADPDQKIAELRERHPVARLLATIDGDQINRRTVPRHADRRPRMLLRGETWERAFDRVRSSADIPAVLYDPRPPADDHR